MLDYLLPFWIGCAFILKIKTLLIILDMASIHKGKRIRNYLQRVIRRLNFQSKRGVKKRIQLIPG